MPSPTSMELTPRPHSGLLMKSSSECLRRRRYVLHEASKTPGWSRGKTKIGSQERINCQGLPVTRKDLRLSRSEKSALKEENEQMQISLPHGLWILYFFKTHTSCPFLNHWNRTFGSKMIIHKILGSKWNILLSLLSCIAGVLQPGQG